MSDRDLLWLRRLRTLASTLARSPDTDQLLATVLKSAIELTDAERGFLVRLRPQGSDRPRLKVEVGLGFDGGTLRGPEGKVSRTVVDRVLSENRSVVTAREEDGDLIDITSVQQQRVRSIACVPLRLRGEIVGVLYLDHRFVREAFTDDDLPCLEAFCDHAALTLETTELRSEQRRHERELNHTLEMIDALKAPGSLEALPPLDQIPRVGRLVGGSRAMHDVYRSIEQAARGLSPVLIVGETGVGKRLIAREIHRWSARSDAPFVIQSCTGAPEKTIEAELCGVDRGILSGVLDPHQGAFQEAAGGTLYLPDIGALSLGLQARVMAALRTRTIVPAEGRPRPISCRVIASVSSDPEELVRSGQLREDLFCRLDVGRVEAPPLRERAEDIPALLAHFFDRGGHQVPVARTALDRLVDHAWPGNIRELENESQRLLSLGGVEAIQVEHLSPEIQAQTVRGAGKTLQEVKRELVEAALRETDGNRTRAANRLGIPRSTFYRLLAQYDAL